LLGGFIITSDFNEIGWIAKRIVSYSALVIMAKGDPLPYYK